MTTMAMRCGFVAAMVLAAASPALAQDPRPGQPLCLQTNRIDHTSHPDDRTLMIHMDNRKVYRATMVNDCVGLRNSTGFIYEPTRPGSNEICSNLWSIRLRDSGQTCLVGAIAPEPATR